MLKPKSLVPSGVHFLEAPGQGKFTAVLWSLTHTNAGGAEAALLHSFFECFLVYQLSNLLREATTHSQQLVDLRVELRGKQLSSD